MELDRLSIRRRPASRPLGHQVWDKLLFMHWSFPQSMLRPLIPAGLTVDTFEGQAWVGVTPFTIPGMRPAGMPPLPLEPTSHEINVRTYVHHDGVPGVWFLSLDASSTLAVIGARLGYGLPYYRARMRLSESDGEVHFTSARKQPAKLPAQLDVRWRPTAPLPEAEPGTLAFFLIERYCLYAKRAQRLYRARIYHRPWPLQSAELRSWSSTMLEAQGLPARGEPLVHAQAAPLDVDIWPLRPLDGPTLAQSEAR